jgi:hypothetical protein
MNGVGKVTTSDEERKINVFGIWIYRMKQTPPLKV